MFSNLLKQFLPLKNFMLGFDPLTIGAITLGSGLLSGIFGGGKSPQEEAVKKILDELDANGGYFKDTPFSKDELFNTIMPAIQKTQRGAADVAAGRLGSAVGEADVAGGAAQFDYYLQSLAPVIAQGESEAANTYKQFTQLWAGMDAQAKNRFLQSMQLKLGAAGGLSDMTEGQKFLSNFMSGANIGASAYGNVSQGLSLADKGSTILDMAGQAQKSNQALSFTGLTDFTGTSKTNPLLDISKGGL